jgi:hypothetical protein
MVVVGNMYVVIVSMNELLGIAWLFEVIDGAMLLLVNNDV